MVSLRLLEEVFEIALDDQVFEAAHGMNGAGRYGGQCGLVEGMIMFLGIWAKANKLPYEETQKLCREYAERFYDNFGSLTCASLRPEAEKSARDPEHPCEELKIQAIQMDIQFLSSTK